MLKIFPVLVDMVTHGIIENRFLHVNKLGKKKKNG